MEWKTRLNLSWGAVLTPDNPPLLTPLAQNVGGATFYSKNYACWCNNGEESSTFSKLNWLTQFHDIHGQVDDESATGANCICRDALEYIQRGWVDSVSIRSAHGGNNSGSSSIHHSMISSIWPTYGCWNNDRPLGTNTAYNTTNQHHLWLLWLL